KKRPEIISHTPMDIPKPPNREY
ncbi:hypothetical protein CEXT_52771, partial [Caerostris extrusa]